ncbi:uncharacterized protein [Nicotiana sylvestris]|uniref:uncharacterized protein n=1 Tax=Nicotiana sylvestris TaxID=4096 RepID=UPI00388C696C
MKDGDVVVQLMEEDIEEENQNWNRAVILYVLGNTPSIGTIERFLANQWVNVHKPKVLFHNDGYFIVLLNNSEEREYVMLNGPYTINSRSIIIRPWSENFDFNEEVLKTIPLCVKLPKRPLNYWSKQALSKIVNDLVKPLYANTCTTIAERASYARFLIEMDVTRPLSENIKLYDPRGRVIEQMVQFDWKPQYCQTCYQIGHSCSDQKNQKHEGMIQKSMEIK